MTTTSSLPVIPLASGIRSRYVENVNGLRVHVLEAGFELPDRACVLLLHGFPELAFCWRKVMIPLAEAGYHVIAPDQRGYGRTSGWDPDYDGDLASFRLTNLVRDALGVVAAFGYDAVDAVIGHDFGSAVAAWCGLIRPDVFRSVVMMSAPFAGAPRLPFNSVNEVAVSPPEDHVHRELAALPRPRKHYQWYYTTREADSHMRRAPQGVHAFLRAYYHYKSADWKGEAPYPLKSWSAAELANMPTYYIMERDKDMPATVAEHMPSAAAVAANQWLPDTDLSFCSAEFARTGFQGGLQWYRCALSSRFNSELQIWSGRSIDVPSLFIAGKQDWGIYQHPGAYESMLATVCSRMAACHLIDGAGHWVQQEQPAEVGGLLQAFLRDTFGNGRDRR
ncbi:alpha/beta hydrolase [Bradyrhizobium sp. NAS96.2]|uniref:alpha/beta hydrolase n=1 Tax=Bradyrhizobium sp. NAS96.2 TaxID=1680160 RepID=UPI00093DEC05|nr:alpha/beta hydrolase [Bradyrhizobium sp. NAS96.2]OKO82943.1 alpha/beta hydrolase [Bradyrhizobium sp. NAS96.2]